MPDIEVTAENWDELYARGFRHFLNVSPEKLSEEEFRDLLAFAKRAAGGEDRFALGVFYDELDGPRDRRLGLGLYIKRPAGWSPY